MTQQECNVNLVDLLKQ